jgi:hypothetical protein
MGSRDYLRRRLFRRFELVQEGIDILIPSLQNSKAVLMQDDQKHISIGATI